MQSASSPAWASVSVRPGGVAVASGRRRTRSVCIVAALGLFLGVATACTGSNETTSHVHIRATPPTGARAQGETFLIAGLAPQEVVTLSLRATDARHVIWESHATFAASAEGTVDTAHANSIGGDFKGTVPMGLMSYLKPQTSPRQAHFFGWPGLRGPQSFTVTVTTDDHPVASTTFTRTYLATDTKVTITTLASQGFVGSYYHLTRPPAGRQPAVLVFGGSEGGNNAFATADDLASAG